MQVRAWRVFSAASGLRLVHFRFGEARSSRHESFAWYATILDGRERSLAFTPAFQLEELVRVFFHPSRRVDENALEFIIQRNLPERKERRGRALVDSRWGVCCFNKSKPCSKQTVFGRTSDDQCRSDVPHASQIASQSAVLW